MSPPWRVVTWYGQPGTVGSFTVTITEESAAA